MKELCTIVASIPKMGAKTHVQVEHPVFQELFG